MPWGSRPRKTLEERFWAFVMPEPNSGCWLWMGYVEGGYGRIGVGRKAARAHRVSYELFVGPIPDRLQLDHLCRVPACVNPDHLEPVTSQINCLRGIGNNASGHVRRQNPGVAAMDALGKMLMGGKKR